MMDAIETYFKKGDMIYLYDRSYVHKPSARVNDKLDYHSAVVENKDLYSKRVKVVSDPYIVDVCLLGRTFKHAFMDIECDGEIYSVISDRHSHYINKSDFDRREREMKIMTIEFDYAHPKNFFN